MNRLKSILTMLALLGVFTLSAHAEGSAPVVTGIVSAVEAIFISVAGLAVTMAGFWLGFRVVKKIKG